jgi:hypothetical protein
VSCHGDVGYGGCHGHQDAAQYEQYESGYAPEEQYLSPPDEPSPPSANQAPVVEPGANVNGNASVNADVASPSDVPPTPPTDAVETAPANP